MEKSKSKDTGGERLSAGVAPFISDYVDPDKDKGDRWVIGEREATPAEIGGLKVPPKAGEREQTTVEVALILRRMPFDTWEEVQDQFKDAETTKDIAGNKKTRMVLSPENRQKAFLFRMNWMWLAAENLIMQVGDAEAAAMYSQALGREVKPGEVVRVDKHCTQELKEHWLNRYSQFRENIMAAIAAYEQRDTYRTTGELAGN